MWMAVASCARTGGEVKPLPMPPKYDVARDPVIGPISKQSARAFIAEDCANNGARPSAGDPPATHRVDVGSDKVDQHCGLVFNEVFSDRYVAAFTREVCGATDGVATEACSERLVKTYVARLSERYAGADWVAVNNKCTAYPIECRDGRALERILLASHNASVLAWHDQAVYSARLGAYRAQADAQAADNQATARGEAEDRARAQGIGAAMQTLGKSLAPPPTINCTSNAVGASTVTTCR